MPAEWTISHEEHLVTVRAEGLIGLKDIEPYLDDLMVRGVMPYRKFLDARGGVPDLSDQDMMALGARVSAYAQMGPRGPVAVVVDPGRAYDAALRFMNLAGATRPGEVFTSVDKARRWLNSQPIPA
jgi:hypothetical protein